MTQSIRTSVSHDELARKIRENIQNMGLEVTETVGNGFLLIEGSPQGKLPMGRRQIAYKIITDEKSILSGSVIGPDSAFQGQDDELTLAVIYNVENALRFLRYSRGHIFQPFVEYRQG